MIDLKKIEESSKQVYEDSFDISLLQEDLESKLDEIYQNNIVFQKGKLSKNAFRVNELQLKRESLLIIKAIKEKLKSNNILISAIKEEIRGKEKVKKKRVKKGK